MASRPDSATRPDRALPDERFMARALDLAREGWGQVAPNPMVGAVVVRDGTIVGEGAHRRFGERHAEVEALAAAGSRARGATMYVTLEPCAHHGKTPPCVEAIVGAGITRVVIATRDPNPEAGGGAAVLAQAGVDVALGPMAADAEELNAPFHHAFRSDRPWITLKMAVSLDAAIADARRRPGWITGPASRARAHHLRAGHDAIAVGMGTVLADDPILTVREAPAPRVPPARVIFSRAGRLPLTARLAQRAQEAPVLVVAASLDPNYEHALRELGVEVMMAGSLPEALRSLRARGIRSILLEGGATMAGEFLSAGLVDRLVLFQAPIVLGRDALGAFAHAPAASPAAAGRWRVVSEERCDDDRMVVMAPADR